MIDIIAFFEITKLIPPPHFLVPRDKRPFPPMPHVVTNSPPLRTSIPYPFPIHPLPLSRVTSRSFFFVCFPSCFFFGYSPSKFSTTELLFLQLVPLIFDVSSGCLIPTFKFRPQTKKVDASLLRKPLFRVQSSPSFRHRPLLFSLIPIFLFRLTLILVSAALSSRFPQIRR